MSYYYLGPNIHMQQSCVIYSHDNKLLATLQQIQQWHNLLIKKIEIKNDRIVIITYFPQFFKQNESIIFKHDKNKILHAIKQFMGTLTNYIILNSAIRHNIPVLPAHINKSRFFHIGYGYNSTIIKSASSNKDSKLAVSIQTDKIKTNIIAERLGIPTPQWIEVTNMWDIKRNFNIFEGKEVVIKPYNLTRGMGVYVGIKTLDEAIDRYKRIKKLYRQLKYPAKRQKIIIQERIYGNDYRILVINNKFKLATWRIPAYITGDGKHTIKELIEIENQNPLRDDTKPLHALKPIVIDDKIEMILKENNLTLESILPKGKKLYVRKAASISQGGVSKDVTEQIHPQIKALCESIASTVHAYTLGIDIICQNISKPLTPQNGGLIEINTRPEMYLNVYPAIGKQYEREIGDYFLENLLSNGFSVISTINLVTNNFDINQLSQFKKYMTKPNYCIGVYYNQAIYFIENEKVIKIAENIDYYKAVKALAINPKITTIVAITDIPASQMPNGSYLYYNRNTL